MPARTRDGLLVPLLLAAVTACGSSGVSASPPSVTSPSTASTTPASPTSTGAGSPTPRPTVTVTSAAALPQDGITIVRVTGGGSVRGKKMKDAVEQARGDADVDSANLYETETANSVTLAYEEKLAPEDEERLIGALRGAVPRGKVEILPGSDVRVQAPLLAGASESAATKALGNLRTGLSGSFAFDSPAGTVSWVYRGSAISQKQLDVVRKAVAKAAKAPLASVVVTSPAGRYED